jgi:hypothetical protein
MAGFELLAWFEPEKPVVTKEPLINPSFFSAQEKI